MNKTPPAKPAAAENSTLFLFFNEIGIIEQLSRSAFERVLPAGMTVPQFSVLNHFVRLGGQHTPARLASAFQVSRATMTNTLKRLEESSLIETKRDPKDGRSKKIDITPAGRDMREKAVSALMPVLAAVAMSIDMDMLNSVIPVLQQIRAELDSARDLYDGPSQRT